MREHRIKPLGQDPLSVKDACWAREADVFGAYHAEGAQPQCILLRVECIA